MKLSTPILLELWRRAATEEFGIAITLPEADIARVKQALYTARQSLLDPTLKDLVMCLPSNGEIWLVKPSVEMEL